MTYQRRWWGGVRQLGIPIIGDRMAQAVVTRYLELLGQPAFHEDSYGFRPGRSALGAVATTPPTNEETGGYCR
ncbi:MAG: hypothetical protein WBO24_08990 [Nitrospirales bacterium]